MQVNYQQAAVPGWEMLKYLDAKCPQTRAASGIPEFDELLDKAKAKAPARSLVSIDDVGVATAFLAHDAARLITGETLYIDGGYHIID